MNGVILFGYPGSTYDATDETIVLNITGRNFGPSRLRSRVTLSLEPLADDTTGTPSLGCEFQAAGDSNMLCEVCVTFTRSV